MICSELINSGRRRNNINQGKRVVDLDRYHRLPPKTQNLISGWFGRAYSELESSEDNCFESFIFAWIAFNAWAACVSDIDQDSAIIRALMQSERINRDFAILFDSVLGFRSHVIQFSRLWPIFEVKSARYVYHKDGDDREDIIKRYFDSGATVYSPQCGKRHKDEGSAIPVDWPHTLAALYRVRCNLFHGEKALGSENDRQIVSCAASALIYFLEGSKYLISYYI